MAAIQKRTTKGGRTRYRALVRLKGYPAQTATFERKTDAKDWAKQTEAAIKEGRYFPRAEALRHTLADLVDRYMTDVLPGKPKSEAKQRAQLTWWKSELGERVLADVTPALIAEYRDQLGRTRAAGTVNRYLAALSHAFTMAVKEWAWVDMNPVRNVRRPREPRGRVRFLSDDERERLLAACRESKCPPLYPVVLLAVSTGARQGELLSLRWSDVDLKQGMLRFEDTKNGERRAVPVAGAALGELRRWGKVRRIDTDFVFPHPKKPTPMDIRSAWEAARDTAALTDFRFHDLRHTAASYLAMSSATLAEIAEILGHKTLSMVKRYSHLTEQHTSKVVARMNAQFLG